MDPSAPHASGIYFVDNQLHQKLTQIYPTVYSQSKSGGFFTHAMTLGIKKVKSKAVLSGSHARYQIPGCTPTFYFYFELSNTSLSNSGGGPYASGGTPATSPNEFVLVQTEIKKNSRELIVGQMNAFGAQSGTLDQYIRPFDFDEVSTGIFKVTPRASLTSGEYAFFYGGSSTVATFGYSNINTEVKCLILVPRVQRTLNSAIDPAAIIDLTASAATQNSCRLSADCEIVQFGQIPRSVALVMAFAIGSHHPATRKLLTHSKHLNGSETAKATPALIDGQIRCTPDVAEDPPGPSNPAATR